ncbi:thy-1 membrane glycoprotein-like [Megalops cyprinoides]|uniref:thy-1 membrane glycoprotein-like n=1 Tax=Megalops cyprinoides TaxID=118141 RepID=UPI001864B831|nr:thy-1 membrane glycoprotein-like [Megalops cyprinoides]
MNSLFICSIFLTVLVASGFCKKILVCQEETDIRVECRLEPRQNQINNYEFSISKNNKEAIINTNVTGITADVTFKDKTRVEPLQPFGFKLTLSNFPITENTTFICKTSNLVDSVFIQKGKMETCSAISVFLQSCPWLLPLLVCFHAV